MDTNASDAGTAALKGVRRAAIWTIIVSLVIAAGIGIATIVSGEFGETQGKVLLTTLAVAAFAVLALCHLAIITRDVRIVGWIGIGTSVLAFVAAAILIWWEWDTYYPLGPGDFYMAVTKTFLVSTLAAVSFAHANLMLLLANTQVRWMRIALDLNLVLIGLVIAEFVFVIIIGHAALGSQRDAADRLRSVRAVPRKGGPAHQRCQDGHRLDHRDREVDRGARPRAEQKFPRSLSRCRF